MDDHGDRLTAEQYHMLYRRAFERLEDIVRLTERAMQDLEELQLSLGEGETGN